MHVYLQALRRRGAAWLVWSLAVLSLIAYGASPATADDTAAWFGQAYRGTNLGLAAGVMYVGARHSGEEYSDRVGAGSRAEGARSSRRAPRRGTRVASLGFTPASAGRDDIEETLTRREKPSSRKARAAKKAAPRRTRLASLGSAIVPKPDVGPSLSGGSVRWAASANCLNSGLRAVVASVAANFGPVTVNSTCRSRRHNARVGGARHSHHLTGNAVDFRIRGSWQRVLAFLRSNGIVGGIKHYGGGLFHIDTGPRRTW